MELYANFTRSKETDELNVNVSSLEDSKKESTKMHAFQVISLIRIFNCNCIGFKVVYLFSIGSPIS